MRDERKRAHWIFRRHHCLQSIRCQSAVSRAFGDTQYDNKGISHTPEITAFTKQLEANQQAFVRRDL